MTKIQDDKRQRHQITTKKHNITKPRESSTAPGKEQFCNVAIKKKLI